MCCFPPRKRKSKRPDMRIIMPLILISTLTLFSCVETGKPVKKVVTETSTKTDKKIVYHYTCPKGHKGSDKSGVCAECGSIFAHNQDFHGKQVLTLPAVVNDANKNSTPANNTPPPAQNAYGDYHYICPNGHIVGSGKADNCSACGTKLAHNQAYHR